MPVFDIKDKRVTILGAGRSGLAMAELVFELKGIPKISETESLAAKTDAAEWLQARAIESEWGGHSQSFVLDSDFVLLSPGIPAAAEPVQWALKKGIPVYGEIEFASRFCSVPIIAVTGSNGKTTVVTLIKEIFDHAGIRNCLCGNIGVPFSREVLSLKDAQFVVLEVSSFQLEYIDTFKPYIAVLLNVSENHLDRHADTKEYFEAKQRIFENQDNKDYAVLNYRDPAIRDLKSRLNATVVYFNSPEASDAADIKNPNRLAALAVGKLVGVSGDICSKVFENFKGVEHRMEWVRRLDGVDYINDSKSTTAESGRWALNNANTPVVMICGGRDKNIDFSVLKDCVKEKVKKICVIGEARKKIKSVFSDVVDVEECVDLKHAVEYARINTSEGDSIIFSPMCASFDMFKNFEERGKKFKDIVRGLN